jgi:hypothetical protein
MTNSKTPTTSAVKADLESDADQVGLGGRYEIDSRHRQRAEGKRAA